MVEQKNYSRYAIIDACGKQYQVVEGKTVALELLPGNPGDTVTFDKVLFRKTADEAFEIGQPNVPGAVVTASIVKHTQGKKLIVFRFKRRKKVRVKKGHRQPITVVRIETI